MRQLVFRALVVLGLIIAARPASANIVFMEDFESGTTKWTLNATFGRTTSQAHSGVYSLTDSPSGNYSASTTYIALVTAPFSLVGATNPTLTFWYRQNCEYYDTAYWDVSTNGTTWTVLKSYPNNYPSFSAWTQDIISLASYVGQPTVYVRFRFVVDSTYLDDGWYLDDIQIDDGITSLTVTTPTSATVWPGGSTQAVKWSYDGSFTGAASFKVDYSLDGGSTWNGIATGLPITDTTVSWAVPAGANSSTARVRVQALDSGGVVLGAGTSASFNIDSTPPSAFTLYSPQNGGCVGTTPTLTWNAATGAYAYTLSVTPAGGSPITRTTTSNSYPFGAGEPLTTAGSPYTWYVTAVDVAGNATVSNTWSFFADNLGPSAFAEVAPAANAYVKSAATYSWTAATDNGCSGTVTYRLFFDGSTSACGTSTTTSVTSTCTLADGPHSWRVQATDGLGNVTWCNEAPGGVGGRTVTVDNTPPSGTVLTAPASGAVVGTATPTFSWTAATDSGSGGVTYQLYIDSNPVGSPGTALSVTPPTSLTEGNHTWKVRASDLVGNYVETSQWTFYADLGSPGAFALSTPANNACSSSPTPNLCWSASTDAGGIASYQIFIDNVGNGITPNGTTLCQTPSAALTQGTHVWTVKAKDRGGNVSPASETRSLMIDWTPPTGLTLVAPADGATVASPAPILTWTAATDPAAILRYDVYVDGTLRGNVAGNVLSYSPAGLALGTHTWYVNAVDSCANLASATVRQFTTTPCVSGTNELCAGSSVGICRPGTRTCTASGTWGTCSGVVSATTETCNGMDDDCDGQTDEAPLNCCTNGTTQSCYTGAAGTVNQGVCKAGTQTCSGSTWGSCVGQVVPGSETCNQLDDDCDGQTDEGLTSCCTSGTTQTCYTGAGGTVNVGVCKAGTQSCVSSSWGTCVAQVVPGTETCNGLDDNCNGQTDEGLIGCVNCAAGATQTCYSGPSGTVNKGKCVAGTQTCSGGVWGTCVGQVVPGSEICDGEDNDCDEQTDEGLTNCVSCVAGTTRACYAGPAGTQGVGACKDGTQTCQPGAWSSCVGSVLPAVEICDGQDNDCDGQTDEGLTGCDSSRFVDSGAGGQGGLLDASDVDAYSHLAQSGGCGCSTTGSGTPAVFLVFGLGLLVVRRRRRSARGE